MLRWRPYRLRLRSPVETATGVVEYRQGLHLELVAADGLVGRGDVAPWPGTEALALPDAATWLDGVACSGVCASERALATWLAGTEAVTTGERAARAALETALLDLQAQRAGLPLARSLSPAARVTVPVNALIGRASVDETVAAARAAVALGFRTLKLKVRIEPSEVERVAAVRAAVGSGMRLRLDANGTASLETARDFARAVAPLEIEYLEQPVGTLEELAELRRRSPVAVAVDEALAEPAGLERALALEAADVFVCKLPLWGGLERVVRLAEELARRSLVLVVTSTLESAIGLAAAVHVAAAVPVAADLAHGLATGQVLELGPEDGWLEPVCGRLRLPERPGLGVLGRAEEGRGV